MTPPLEWDSNGFLFQNDDLTSHRTARRHVGPDEGLPCEVYGRIYLKYTIVGQDVIVENDNRGCSENNRRQQ